MCSLCEIHDIVGCLTGREETVHLENLLIYLTLVKQVIWQIYWYLKISHTKEETLKRY